MDKSRNEKSVALLNKAAADELSAIHQYLYFHFHCDDQGFDLLANLFKRVAIEEMTHLEKLADRILFLKGDITMNASDKVNPIRSVKEMLEKARSMEADGVREYNLWANECSANADAVSKQLFEDLLKSEEKHFSLFDVELANIEKFGTNYLALQSIERSKGNAVREH